MSSYTRYNKHWKDYYKFVEQGAVLKEKFEFERRFKREVKELDQIDYINKKIEEAIPKAKIGMQLASMGLGALAAGTAGATGTFGKIVSKAASAGKDTFDIFGGKYGGGGSGDGKAVKAALSDFSAMGFLDYALTRHFQKKYGLDDLKNDINFANIEPMDFARLRNQSVAAQESLDLQKKRLIPEKQDVWDFVDIEGLLTKEVKDKAGEVVDEKDTKIGKYFKRLGGESETIGDPAQGDYNFWERLLGN